MLNYLTKLSSVRLYVPKDLRSADSRFSVRKSIEAVQKKFPDGLPLLDPCKDMKIKHEEFKVGNELLLFYATKQLFMCSVWSVKWKLWKVDSWQVQFTRTLTWSSSMACVRKRLRCVLPMLHM